MTDIPQDQVEAVARALLAKDWEKSGVDENLPPEIWKAYVPDAIAAIRVLTPLIAAVEREKLNAWMIRNSIATGHGDTIEDLLLELDRHIDMMDADFAHAAAVERERCAALVEDFPWQLPLYDSYEANVATDDAVSSVVTQIAESIRSVKGAVT